MKLINSFLLTLLCAATISSCNAMTPEQQEQVNRQLIDASRLGNVPAVQQALAAGADIHMQDDFALQQAAAGGHLQTVRFLIEHGADIHADGDMPLRSAATHGHLAVLQYMLEQVTDVHAVDRALQGAFVGAIMGGRLLVMQWLIEHGVNISTTPGALIWAAMIGQLDIVQFLVERGANIHVDNDDALRLAAEYNHWTVVDYLLRHGANRAVLTGYRLALLHYHMFSECKTALRHDNWHRVEELCSTIPVHELPYYIKQQLRAILVPAVENKLDSVPLVLFLGTQIRNTDLASRTLSFIVGPHTRAAFSHLVKEDTVVGPNMASE